MAGSPPMKRTLAVVHNNVDDQSAIGAIAKWAVEAGLQRNWDVTVVCRDLDVSLVDRVRHRPLYVPPRVHLLQWSVARATIKHALAGWRPDAMLVYQPQVAAIADVWHVEYLSRAARRAAGPRRPGVNGWVEDAQGAGVAKLEDSYLRRIPASTTVLFCSDGLRDQYSELYGLPASSGVLYNPALLEVGRRVDTARRAELTYGHVGPVVGFLGGGSTRKGGDLIVQELVEDPSMFLLHAGPGLLDDSAIRSHSRGLGHLRDVTELLDVVDVLLVPSRFEPFGLVVAEAAARGVPALMTATVGAAPLAVETGAGAVWDSFARLRPQVDRLIARRSQMAGGGAELVDRLNPTRLADQLFAALEAAAERNRGKP